MWLNVWMLYGVRLRRSLDTFCTFCPIINKSGQMENNRLLSKLAHFAQTSLDCIIHWGYTTTIVSSFVPSAITQPFFELQTPDFAWKFVWTVPTNYEIFFLVRGVRRGGVQGRQGVTQPFFELHTPDFAWKFVWTAPTNYENFFW